MLRNVFVDPPHQRFMEPEKYELERQAGVGTCHSYLFFTALLQIHGEHFVIPAIPLNPNRSV
jgi:hypothetical protein